MKVFVISGIILLIFWQVLNFTVKQAERIGKAFEKKYSVEALLLK